MRVPWALHVSKCVSWVALLGLAVMCSAETTKHRIADPREAQVLGDKALSAGNVALAVDYYTQLIGLQPKPESYYKRAQAFLRKRNYLKVVQDLNKAIAIDADFTKGYTLRATVHTITGDCAQARSDYMQVLRLEPNHKKAREKLPVVDQCIELGVQAENALVQENWGQLLQLLEPLLKHASSSLRFMVLRTEALFRMGQYPEALASTREGLKLDSNNLDILYLRGSAYYYMGEHDTALTHFKQGLKSDPEHVKLKAAFKTLQKLKKTVEQADALANQGRPEQAAEAFEEARKIDPRHALMQYQILIKLCRAYYQAQNGAKSVEACTDAINLQPDNIEGYLERVEAYIVNQQYQEAVNDANKARQMDGSSRAAQEKLQKANVELKKSTRKDYYKILGVPPTATKANLKAAFRKLALQYHPDKVEGGEEEKKAAEAKFQQFGEAYEILSDDELRAKYDRGEDVLPNQGGGQQQHNPFHFFQQGGFGHGQTFHFNWG